MSPRPALPLRLEYIFLGLIRRRPIHGYELLQYWNEPDGIGIIWQVKPGPFYAALEKLELLGNIAMTLIPGDAAPTRKEYRITPTGEQVFLNWMSEPVPAARDFRQDFLAKLFFLNDVEPLRLEDLIRQQKVVCIRWHSSLQKQTDAGTGFEHQVQAFRLRQVQAILDWLEELFPAN